MKNCNIVTTDKVIGVEVKNLTQENLGEVKEIVLDKVSGHVCYVTLSVGGFLGMGAKCIAVPWNALRYDSKEECFMMDADKDKLKQAKALENGWSNWSDPTFDKDIHNYFGTVPYCDHKGLSGETTTGTGGTSKFQDNPGSLRK